MGLVVALDVRVEMAPIEQVEKHGIDRGVALRAEQSQTVPRSWIGFAGRIEDRP